VEQAEGVAALFRYEKWRAETTAISVVMRTSSTPGNPTVTPCDGDFVH